jgi:hypothetical protein
VGVSVGGNDVGEAATTAVFEGVSVLLGVHDGVRDGVKEAVNVNEAVSVSGWNGVNVSVAVDVFVGVNVSVGVLLAVLVKMTAVGLKEGVSVTVAV